MSRQKAPPLLHTALFETAWGWCGAGVSRRGVAFFLLPVPDLDTALRNLHEQTSPREDPAVNPPPLVLAPSGWPEAAGAVRTKSVTRDLVRQVRGYFEGRVRAFDLPLAQEKETAFQRRVPDAARAIPYGETRTYGELAAAAGHPGAARAVGRCMAVNPTPLIVPCHRVVAAGGGLGGFSAEGGVALKKRLLEWERQNL